MQINSIEQDILCVVHELPIEKQKEILDFSLFLKNTLTKQIPKESSDFRTALRQFLKKVEQDPIDIDTSLFDADRETESDRDFQL